MEVQQEDIMESIHDMQSIRPDEPVPLTYTSNVEEEPSTANSNDADSIYTEGPDIQPSKKTTYIYSLAEDLFNKALTNEPDEESLERMYSVLPELLKTFALKMGSSAPMQIHRDVMVFVRRHRRLA
jgi:hypothetical protein